MNKEDLISNISKHFQVDTFQNVEYLIDQESSGSYEANEIKNVLINQKWDELDLQTLITNKSILNFLSDAAFIYFLPAYMRLLILEFEAADVIVDSLIEKLILPVEADITLKYIDYKMDQKRTVNLDEFYQNEMKYIDNKVHCFINKTSLLTNEQSKVVLDFLIYIKENYSIFFEENILDKAINRFWFKFS